MPCCESLAPQETRPQKLGHTTANRHFSIAYPSLQEQSPNQSYSHYSFQEHVLLKVGKDCWHKFGNKRLYSLWKNELKIKPSLPKGLEEKFYTLNHGIKQKGKKVLWTFTIKSLPSCFHAASNLISQLLWVTKIMDTIILLASWKPFGSVPPLAMLWNTNNTSKTVQKKLEHMMKD